ncbi:hypothetical protein [Pseudoalteromonas sp. Z1A8]|uniref:hypothetical protein n=1 Tax=Pseudoalteromonas sp. Z1A8 TaxID=2686354 RepID=UPI00140D214C|nr:hypothetical protein [Pseudoalteromonas sp. Z1A8]
MTSTVHNPDQYMYDFQHILTHSKKKIGILIGAGAPVSINVGGDTWEPLIPDIAGLTEIVKDKLEGSEKAAFLEIEKSLESKNIELVLSRVRSLAEVIGIANVYGLNANGYESLSANICRIIKDVVDKSLPKSENPYSHLISWINGIRRDYAGVFQDSCRLNC